MPSAAAQGFVKWSSSAPLFDHVQNGQNKDGSWPAGDGISVGSVYSTAIWCTVLQLDNGSHPSKQRIDLESD
jgi:hypothetical protein